MNKLIFKYIGKVLIGFSILLLFPIWVCLIYSESIIPFVVPLIISLFTGIILNSLKVKNMTLYAKDGFIIVALSWIFMSILGALPFLFIKIPFYDAIFESISGFTTTGATIFKDVEKLSKGFLFWRSFTHFIGGMGVLTFVMAIIPLSRNDKSMHLLKAEMPGPNVAKLVPSLKKTLLFLYAIYIGLTTLELLFLLIGGLDLFNSLLISMSTAGTGGFTVFNNSLVTLSIFNKYIVSIFMFLFGVNFNIFFLIIVMKNIKNALKSEELKVYILMYIFAVLFVLINIIHLFSSFKDALISSIFHVSSIMSSTGFSIGNINIYPTQCRILLLFLMLVSACAGSTCGGFKISRLIICVKKIKRDILKVIHPNSVHTITFDGKKVDDNIVNNTSTFIFLYIILILIIMLIVSFNGFDLETTINAVFSTFANVGLCFRIPDFSAFSALSKIVLSIGMLFGRLEIFPLIVLFSNLRK